MGEFTEFHLNTELFEVPKNMQKILDGDKYFNVPDHPFFKIPMWRCFFKGNAYFSLIPFAKLDKYTLNIQVSVKDPNEIDLFLDWIWPYVESYAHELVGFIRNNHESNVLLLYNCDGELRKLWVKAQFENDKFDVEPIKDSNPKVCDFEK